MSEQANPGENAPNAGSMILVVEDDSQIRRFLRATLTTHGYQVAEVTTGQEALNQISLKHPDLIILDLGLPNMDGLDVIRALREWSSTPIIVVSARELERDKVQALDAGADDYLTKPFGTAELLARIRVALRHSIQLTTGEDEPIFSVGDLQVDLAHHQVYVEDSKVHLTPIEYKLLVTLVRHAGKVITGHQLLKEVWGPSFTKESQYLRLYMMKLRHKLEKDPAEPRYLITEPGVGYRLNME
ncbi:MAG TPA: response regulator [Aggregatilineales bacterium]|nr:response regulator [Aggregatilineales bacterium]